MENDLNENGLIEIDLKENALIANRSNFFQSPLEVLKVLPLVNLGILVQHFKLSPVPLK